MITSYSGSSFDHLWANGLEIQGQHSIKLMIVIKSLSNTGGTVYLKSDRSTQAKIKRGTRCWGFKPISSQGRTQVALLQYPKSGIVPL